MHFRIAAISESLYILESSTHIWSVAVKRIATSANQKWGDITKWMFSQIIL
jgi:hypothetical protein